jgi:hypothetical protein
VRDGAPVGVLPHASAPGGRRSSDGPSAGQQVVDQDDHRDDQQEVDEATADAPHEADQPQDDDYDEYQPQDVGQ